MAAPAASANVETNPSSTINITVECIWWNTSKTLHLSLNKPSLSQHTSDDDGEENNRSNKKVDRYDDDEDFRKYSMCSLLLQLGQLFDIQPPPYAPSSRLSSIFNKLLECWSLQQKSNAASASSKSTYCKKKIRNLSDINDGDELLFSFGDYFKKISRNNDGNAEKNGGNNITKKKNAADGGGGEKELDILQLLPKKYNLVTVRVINVDGNNNDDNTNGKRSGKKVQKKDIECIELLSSSSSSDDDDEVEDVTELYRKSRPPPEVIEVEDASDSSSEDEHHDEKKSRSHNNCNNMWGNHSLGVDNLFGSGSDHSSDKDEFDDDDDDSFIEDVTDQMLAKKQEEQQKLIDDAELLETDSEDDTKKKRRRKRRSTTQEGRKRRKVHVSPLEVVIEDKDVPDCPGASCEEENDNDNQVKEGGTDDNNNEVDLSIKQRIVKLLNTGLHCESNEHEAKNAMKLARRLLDRYNLDQAILLKERGDGSLNDFCTTNDKDDLGIKGGIVTVNVLNRKKSVPLSTMPRWLEHLIAPVTANFQVDAFVSFSRTAGQCAISFYGIKTNVQLAAYAFKIAAERIAFMAATYEIPRSNNSFRGKRSKQSSQTRTARLSYALGIVAGLHEDVKRGLQEEEEKRQEDLKRARHAAKTTGEVHQEDCSRDKEKEEQEQQRVPAEETLHQLENENEARLALIDCNKKVANDVLKVR